MCYARTSRRSATRRLGISFSRQTRLRFRSSRATGFSLLWSEMFIARQPINIPLRRSGMCYARTSRRSATRRLGISFSRQTRLRFRSLERRVFRSSRATCFSLLSSDRFFAPLERRVFRSSRATCLSLPRATCFSLLSSDVFFAPLERRVFRSSRATCFRSSGARCL